MSKKIADLEEVNLVAKSWQMGGETTGKGRPLNRYLCQSVGCTLVDEVEWILYNTTCVSQ